MWSFLNLTDFTLQPIHEMIDLTGKSAGSKIRFSGGVT
jgi:hypothetical protein